MFRYLTFVSTTIACLLTSTNAVGQVGGMTLNDFLTPTRFIMDAVDPDEDGKYEVHEVDLYLVMNEVSIDIMPRTANPDEIIMCFESAGECEDVDLNWNLIGVERVFRGELEADANPFEPPVLYEFSAEDNIEIRIDYGSDEAVRWKGRMKSFYATELFAHEDLTPLLENHPLNPEVVLFPQIEFQNMDGFVRYANLYVKDKDGNWDNLEYITLQNETTGLESRRIVVDREAYEQPGGGYLVEIHLRDDFDEPYDLATAIKVDSMSCDPDSPFGN